MDSLFLTDITMAGSFFLGFLSKLGGKWILKTAKTKYSYYLMAWLMSTQLILPLWHLNSHVLSAHENNIKLMLVYNRHQMCQEVLGCNIYQNTESLSFKISNTKTAWVMCSHGKHCSMIPNERHNIV